MTNAAGKRPGRNWLGFQDARLRGFTLVELLVVIAIIGTLVALLLPAIQAAREAARRSQCQNNLKQIGLALQNIHSADRALPQGVYTDPNSNTSPGLSWMTRILPYIEEQAKYNLIADHVPPSSSARSAWEFYQPFLYAGSLPGGVIPSSDVPIAGFNCPSSGLPQFVPNHVSKAVARGLATTCYKGSKGVGRQGVFVRPDPGDVGRIRYFKPGPVGTGDGVSPQILELEQPRYTRLSFKQITDGLSNTIAVAEAAYAIQYGSGAGQERWPIWIGTPGGDWDETILFKTEFTPNCEFGTSKAFWEFTDPTVLAAKGKLDSYGPSGTDNRVGSDVNDCSYGWHTGGILSLFVDGSVHFLPEDIDHRTFMYLGNPSDDQILQGLDL